MLGLLFLSFKPPLISQILKFNTSKALTCAEHAAHIDSIFSYNLLKSPGVRAFVKEYTFHNTQCASYPAFLNLMGFIAYTQNDIIHARRVLLQADSLFREVPGLSLEHYVRNQIFLGLTYSIQGKPSKAISYFKKAQEESHKIGNKVLFSEAVSNLGWAFLQKEDHEKALEYLNQARVLSLGTNNWENLGYIYQNLAQVHLDLDQYRQAKFQIKNAERIWKTLKDTTGLYYVAQIRADILFKEKNWEGNIDALEDAILYGEKQNITHLHGVIFSSLGDTYSLVGDMEKAKSYYEKAIKYAESLPFEQLSSFSKKLAALYMEENNAGKLGQLVEKQVQVIQRKFELQLLENKKSLQNEMELEKERIKTEFLFATTHQDKKKLSLKNVYISLLLILSLITGVACLSSYFQLQQKRDLYQKIQLQKNELEEINHKLSYTSELISTQNERLKMQNQELHHFAYMVSHDLKAPLLNMENFSKLLLKKWGKEVDSQFASMLKFIEKGSRDMHRLVTDLLEFSKLEKKELNISSLCPENMINGVIESLHGVIDKKQANIHLGALPPEINADPIKLKLVFQNLIHNALKFVPCEVPPLVKVYAKEQKGHFVFYIQDNGIGINPAYQDKIFNMFNKLHPSSEFEGTGIGLATCKKIIRLHGGNMGLNSVEGQGSTFYFSLPKNVLNS